MVNGETGYVDLWKEINGVIQKTGETKKLHNNWPGTVADKGQKLIVGEVDGKVYPITGGKTLEE